jgi:hypothetical protein
MARAIFKALQVPGFIEFLPAIKDLRGDAALPKSEPGIEIVGVVVIDQFKSLFSFI